MSLEARLSKLERGQPRPPCPECGHGDGPHDRHQVIVDVYGTADAVGAGPTESVRCSRCGWPLLIVIDVGDDGRGR